MGGLKPFDKALGLRAIADDQDAETVSERSGVK
jgi:hypothetical protein